MQGKVTVIAYHRAKPGTEAALREAPCARLRKVAL